MNFGDRTAARKKSKELKTELKELRKDIITAGVDKNQATEQVKEFFELLQLGKTLQEDYTQAGNHLKQARESIMKLLECMGVSPATEVKESLRILVSDLEQVYHDCSIREDDIDFQSTIASLKPMVESYSQTTAGMEEIMLRSELENIKAVLDDAAGWKAPDFLALAYYFRHEEKSNLKEMENAKRSAFVSEYFKEHFMNQFEKTCQEVGVVEKIKELEQLYVYA